MYYLVHCFWLVLVVVCTTTTMFMFVKVFWVSLHGEKCKCVQYNGGLLPDIVLLTQCYYHRGTRLNAMKMFSLCSL